MPLIVFTLYVTALPTRVRPVRVVPPGPAVGRMLVRLVAPVPTEISNVSAFDPHARFRKDEALRPSTNSRTSLAATTGTPRVRAEFSSAVSGCVLPKSVCMLATK